MKPNIRLKLTAAAAAGAAISWIPSLIVAQDANPEASPPAIDLGAPQKVSAEDFENVKANSPFTRSLNLSDSLTLTGVMNIGEVTIATVMDKESKEIYVVGEAANPQGWRMVGVEGDRTDLAKITAKIAVAGGEVVSVRFDERQLKPAGVKPAGGGAPRGGPGLPSGPGGGPGFGGGPPPEVMAKMRTLTDDQRQKLGEYMNRIRQEKPDMSREEMRDHFYKAVERVGGGKDGKDGGGGGGGGDRDRGRDGGR